MTKTWAPVTGDMDKDNRASYKDCVEVETPVKVEQGKIIRIEERVRTIQEELYERHKKDGSLPLKNGKPITHDDYVDGMLGNDTNRGIEKYFGDPKDSATLDKMSPQMREQIEFIQKEHPGLLKVLEGEKQLVCPVETPQDGGKGIGPGIDKILGRHGYERIEPESGKNWLDNLWDNTIGKIFPEKPEADASADAYINPSKPQIADWGKFGNIDKDGRCYVDDFSSEGGTKLHTPYALYSKFGEAHDNKGGPLDSPWLNIKPAPMPMLPESQDVTGDKMLLRTESGPALNGYMRVGGYQSAL